jgi:DNA mismatch repair protein MutS2
MSASWRVAESTSSPAKGHLGLKGTDLARVWRADEAMAEAPIEQRFDLGALEFQVARDLLAERLSSPLGRAAVEALCPLASAELANRALAQAEALAGRLAVEDRAPISGVVEVRSWLGPFFAGEHVLDARDLADLKRLLRTANRCRSWLGTEGTLADLAAELENQTDLVEELELVVDDRGEILDTASVKLSEVRRDIESARGAVHVAVREFVTQAGIDRYLQSTEPSWRHGRPVFQVRQIWRGKVPGVLHDRSQSGATVFIEPDRIVEVANRLSDAQAAEHREVQVVLAQIGRGLRRWAEWITGAVAWLAELDLATARARLIHEAGFHPAPVVPGGVLRLHGARHPILMRALGDRAALVPLEVALGDPYRTLVITGPNTGGKTVALKTIGLLSLMALAGVPIPADPGTQIPFLNAVQVDIGDEQEISQSLSTFSSHVVRIARCLDCANRESLVLLDELGAGTDPEEGGGLGYAVLEELVRCETLAVVTTHLGRLKDFAYRNPNAENGSMAFDGRSLEPLYRLDVGIPGASHALDIAGRVGMPAAVVARARALLGERDRSLEDAIEGVQSARRSAEEDRRRTAQLTREAESAGERLNQRLAEAERRGTWLDEEADALLQEQLQAIRSALEGPLRHLANGPRPYSEQAETMLKTLAGLLHGTSVHRRRMKFIGGLRKGHKVYLPRWRRDAVIKKVDRVREIAVVEYGKLRMEVPFEDVSWLRPLDDS